MLKTRSAPLARTIQSVCATAPLAMPMIPTAATTGQYDPPGIWMGSGGTSGMAFIWVTDHLGNRLSTSGITVKLYSGGGDGMVHSSVAPPHGSLPATSPFRQLRHTL